MAAGVVFLDPTTGCKLRPAQSAHPHKLVPQAQWIHVCDWREHTHTHTQGKQQMTQYASANRCRNTVFSKCQNAKMPPRACVHGDCTRSNCAHTRAYAATTAACAPAHTPPPPKMSRVYTTEQWPANYPLERVDCLRQMWVRWYWPWSAFGRYRQHHCPTTRIPTFVMRDGNVVDDQLTGLGCFGPFYLITSAVHAGINRLNAKQQLYQLLVPVDSRDTPNCGWSVTS
jgi:hypothetical protein